MKEWHNPFLPDQVAEDVFKNFTTVLHDCQDWVTFNGFNNQCDNLMKNSQLQSHPVLKKMQKERNYVLRHNALLCGMLKYEIYLKRQAAAAKLEHQSLGIVITAHVYNTGNLEQHEQGGPQMPTWPDMEFALYAQDPAWIFVGGFPETVK